VQRLSAASATCRRRWRCSAPGRGSSVRSTAGSTPWAGRTRSSPMAVPSPRWSCAGRQTHLLHVGDTRAYRLSGERMTLLTTDHVRQDGSGRSHMLNRALASSPKCASTTPASRWRRTTAPPVQRRGAWLAGPMSASPNSCASAPPPRTPSEAWCGRAQLGQRRQLHRPRLDVVALPTAASADISDAIMRLRYPGADRRYDGRRVCVAGADLRGPLQPPLRAPWTMLRRHRRAEIPQPEIASVAVYHSAFVAMAWVGARVNNPWSGRSSRCRRDARPASTR